MSAAVAEPDLPEYVIAELRHESPLILTRDRFAAPSARAAARAESLNAILARYDVRTLRPHFGASPDALATRAAVAAALPPEPSPLRFRRRGLDAAFIQAGFVQIIPKRADDARRIARALGRNEAIWRAAVAPRPVPAWAVRPGPGHSFEPSQGYLYSAPNGIGAAEVWALEGARGAGVTICDVEGNWNRRHESLPVGIPLLGGAVVDDAGWRSHGTAALGAMVARPDGRGVVGISHQARAVLHAAVVDGVFNPARAVARATSALGAGDVILLELQAPGPGGRYLAMQFWDDVFTAIRAAADKGIAVVEAAGNGDENFDQAAFAGTGLQKDSGAIVVGAGVPPTNSVDHEGFGPGLPGYASLGVPRSRIGFSNYGTIVNVQAWGWHVTTLGFGDARGGRSERAWYTLRFSGTSSAAPIVAGAVACLQGRARARHGAPLSPRKLRDILVATGTPQESGPGAPATQHIGPQPNLPRAMRKV